MVAIVGVLQPRLFIADRVIDSLSAEELRATLAHEAGHLMARDNLKRIILRSRGDVLALLPAGRSLDRAWAEAAEAAADEHAARTGAGRALELASALIKIARMVPSGAKPALPAGTFLIGTGPGGVTWRVRRLTELAATNLHPPRSPNAIVGAWWACAGAVMAGTIYAHTSPGTLLTLHALMEHVVAALS